ncbi:MAG: helix-turn-helix transcriptional regulator [Dehalococcoidia bacterium]|nr:helix-turn-helix transcriptional regulator [Dehalococcoidia bacterium]
MPKLEKLRLDRLLTQEQLAKLAGINRATVSRIELGAIKPRPLTIRKLAKALEVPPHEIEF